MEARRSITKQCFSSSAWWDLLCYDNGYVHRTDHFISFGNQRSASAWLMMLTYPGFHPNGRQSIMGFGCVRLRYLSHTECFSTSLSHQYWNFLVFMSRAATVIHVHVGNFPIRIWYTIFFFYDLMVAVTRQSYATITWSYCAGAEKSLYICGECRVIDRHSSIFSMMTFYVYN